MVRFSLSRIKKELYDCVLGQRVNEPSSERDGAHATTDDADPATDPVQDDDSYKLSVEHALTGNVIFLSFKISQQDNVKQIKEKILECNNLPE